MDGVLVDFGNTIAKEMNKNIPLDSLKAHPSSKSKRRVLRKLQNAGITEVTSDDIEEATLKKDTGVGHTDREKIIVEYLLVLLANNKPLWLGMELAPGAHKMVKMARQLGSVYILSSPFDNDSISAKHEWIQEHFSGIFKNVFIEKEKGQTIVNTGIIDKGETVILIDDRVKSQKQLKGTGAQFVLYQPASSEKAAIKTMKYLRGLS